jgi:hypothetical protein
MGEEKLGVFSELDVRIDKKYNFKKLSLEFFLEIQNLLMRETPEAPEYILSRDEAGNIIEPRSLSQIVEEEGQPIPTIGIVIDF